MAQEKDWLLGGSDEIREQQKALHVEFAKNFDIFVNDARGVALLDHWDKTLARKITPTNADIQEYAADNAVRSFISQIHDQIALAREPGG